MLCDCINDIVVEFLVDVLVGVDGIYFVVCWYFYLMGDVLCFVGCMLWCVVIEVELYFDGWIMFMVGYQDQKFVVYLILELLCQQGCLCINWIVELCVFDEVLLCSDWNCEVDCVIFCSVFVDWKWSWIDILVLIDGVQVVYEFLFVDKDLLLCWIFGCVMLLGDVVYLMYLIGLNGSVQVIFDVCVFVDCLFVLCDIGVVLCEYEVDCLLCMVGIVLCNCFNGLEQVMQFVYECVF